MRANFTLNYPVGQSGEIATKGWLIHAEDSLRLYKIARLDIAVRHVLGPDVYVEAGAYLDGTYFVNWVARLSDAQVAKVVDIDGVSRSNFWSFHCGIGSH